MHLCGKAMQMPACASAIFALAPTATFDTN
jgi:hypothetical protein